MKHLFDIPLEKIKKLDAEQVHHLLKEVKKSSSFFLSVFRSLKQAIIVVDYDGRILATNKRRCIISGKRLVERSLLWDVINCGTMCTDVQYAIEHREDLDFKEYTTIVPKLDPYGDVIPDTYETKIIRCGIFPFVEEQEVLEPVFKNLESEIEYNRKSEIKKKKVITGSVICIEDVSMENEREKKNYRDKSFWSMKQVTSGIAHELKNPLGAISLHLQLLRRKLNKLLPSITTEEKENKNKNATLKYIDVIEEEIHNMEKIVNMFLNDFNVKETEFEFHNINKVLIDSLALVGPDLRKHNITVKEKFKTKIPRVFISKYAMTHIFLNIIKNAKEVMENGGELTISTDYADGRVSIGFFDTGGGVPKELEKNIFDPYFTTKETGSGLGLTIAYKLVRLHGGNMNLDLGYKKGAAFIITLPAHADENKLLSNG